MFAGVIVFVIVPKWNTREITRDSTRNLPVRIIARLISYFLHWLFIRLRIRNFPSDKLKSLITTPPQVRFILLFFSLFVSCSWLKEIFIFEGMRNRFFLSHAPKLCFVLWNYVPKFVHWTRRNDMIARISSYWYVQRICKSLSEPSNLYKTINDRSKFSDRVIYEPLRSGNWSTPLYIKFLNFITRTLDRYSSFKKQITYRRII